MQIISKAELSSLKTQVESLLAALIELNDKFHKSSEIKKNLVENKITQMK